MKLACLLTAAGAGSRFGSDKLRLPVDGEPMGVHALKVLSEAPFDLRVLITSRDKGYLISGDYICEVLTEFNVFDADRRNMFMRLQVPVTVSE